MALPRMAHGCLRVTRKASVKVWDSTIRPRKNRYDFEQVMIPLGSPPMEGTFTRSPTIGLIWVAHDCDLEDRSKSFANRSIPATSGTAYKVSPDGSWQATALRDGNIRCSKRHRRAQMTLNHLELWITSCFSAMEKRMWVRTTDSKLSCC